MLTLFYMLKMKEFLHALPRWIAYLTVSFGYQALTYIGGQGPIVTRDSQYLFEIAP